MPSKTTLALVACIAAGSVVRALPMPGTEYDLVERDYADFDLEARMYDDSFEDFVVRAEAAPPAAVDPTAATAVSGVPTDPTGGAPTELAATPGATPASTEAKPKHHGKHRKHRKHRKHHRKHRKHHKKHHHKHAKAAADASAAKSAGPTGPAGPGAPVDPSAPVTAPGATTVPTDATTAPVIAARGFDLGKWWHNLWHPKSKECKEHPDHKHCKSHKDAKAKSADKTKTTSAASPTSTAAAAKATDAADSADVAERELAAEPTTPVKGKFEAEPATHAAAGAKGKVEESLAAPNGTESALPKKEAVAGGAHAHKKHRHHHHHRHGGKNGARQHRLHRHRLHRHQGEGVARLHELNAEKQHTLKAEKAAPLAGSEPVSASVAHGAGAAAPTAAV